MRVTTLLFARRAALAAHVAVVALPEESSVAPLRALARELLQRRRDHGRGGCELLSDFGKWILELADVGAYLQYYVGLFFL